MPNFELMIKKAVRQLRQAGVFRFTRDVIKRSLQHLPDDDFDKINGTDTAGSISLWRFKIPYPSAQYGVTYGSVPEERIRHALENIPRNTTLVDLGCGKGRALIVAARMGFRKIIGVEFVGELVAIALKNLAITGAEAQVILADAGEYMLPGGPLCIYLYNPFSLEIMRKVAAQLLGRKEDIWVVYLNPYCEPGCSELFDAILHRVVDMAGLIVWCSMNRS